MILTKKMIIALNSTIFFTFILYYDLFVEKIQAIIFYTIGNFINLLIKIF